MREATTPLATPTTPVRRLHVFDVLKHIEVSLRADLRKARRTRGLVRQEGFAGSLARDGIVTRPDYAAPAVAARLRQRVLDVADALPEGGTTPAGALVRVRGARRGHAHDEGMVDVFHIDREIPEARLVAEDESLLGDLRAVAGDDLVPRRVNAYINRGVSATRGFHVDSYRTVTYKAFLYLTDVVDEGDGPFSYVRGSHRFTTQKYRSLLRNMGRHARQPTDILHYRRDRVTQGIGDAGTLFVADQNGFHKGVPQAAGRERVLIVTLYTPPDVEIE